MTDTQKYRTNMDVLLEHIQPMGKRILDIGSGDGGLVRALTKKGAVMVGLECGAAQLAKAFEHPPIGDETYVEGFGQDLPFDDASFDVVIFFNSLHHIPEEVMDASLQQATRVCKPGGMIYVAEPVADGSSFLVAQPIDDETFVRALADAALARADAPPLQNCRHVRYMTEYTYADFDAFVEHSTRVDPARRAKFESVGYDAMRARFTDMGTPSPKGMAFDQPMNVTIFDKGNPDE